MRSSILYILICSVLLGISISVPAQNLPALQKDGTITVGELPNGISYYLVTNASMKGVADFALVRKGMSDTLSARSDISSLPHFNKTNPFNFLSRKGIGCRPEGYISYIDDATLFRFDDVPMFDAAAADTTLLMLFDIIASQPKRHAVIISGDINAGAIIQKMNVFALMVPSRNPVYQPVQYSWTPSEMTTWSFSPSDKASVKVDFRSPRTPAAQMNTIQPFISKLFSLELSSVVRNRLREVLTARGIPLNGLEIDNVSSGDTYGDEHFSVRLDVSEDRLIPASMALASVLAGIGTYGVKKDEFKTVREDALALLTRPLSNEDLVQQCISAYLHGSDLALNTTKAKFFTSRNMTLDSEMTLFNNYVYALLGGTENATVSWTGKLENYDEWIYQMMFKSTWSGISMLDKPSYAWAANPKDTSAFASDKNKSKLKTTAPEPVSGGEMWTFSNGMRVIYKKMPTSGRFNYAMMIKGGFSTVRDLPRGEGAYFSDMLLVDRISGISGDSFSKILRASGIQMETKVSASDLRISGSAPSGKYALVMKALLSIVNERKPDTQAFESYRKMELASVGNAVLDSLMFPEYNYSEIKTKTGLTPNTLTDADAFFSREFLKCNDGVIVLVGDLPSEELQKYLAKCIGGFRVSNSVAVRQAATYRMRKGATTYSVAGSPSSISIGLASAAPFTTENYMAFRIAALALKRRLSGAMSAQGYSVAMSQSFKTFPQEAVELIFNLSPVPDAGLPEGIEGGASHPEVALAAARKAIEETLSGTIGAPELAACKSLLTNEYTSSIADPANYADAILMRYSAGKDVLTSYNERIGSVSADNVKGIFTALTEGMRIEYVVKPEE